MGSHREAGDDHPFDELVRVLVDDVAVLEGAGLGFVTVADEVDRLGVVGRDEAPLDAGRETCATPSAESGSLDLIGDRFRFHLESLFGLLVIAFLQGTIHGGVPVFAVDVAKDETMLLGERFFAGLIGDGHGWEEK